MREHSSAFARIRVAITAGWREIVTASELQMARPWEAEGELRWVRDLGGRRLVGSRVPSHASGESERLAVALKDQLPHSVTRTRC